LIAFAESVHFFFGAMKRKKIMSKDLIKDLDFKQWLTDLKVRIRQSQIKAMIKVNDEMLRLYWDLGHDIVVRQMNGFTW